MFAHCSQPPSGCDTQPQPVACAAPLGDSGGKGPPRNDPSPDSTLFYIRKGLSVYTRAITKRLVDIDDAALDKARALLGGATIKDTVNTALREFSEKDNRARLFAHIQQLAAQDLGDPDIMRGTTREQAPE